VIGPIRLLAAAILAHASVALAQPLGPPSTDSQQTEEFKLKAEEYERLTVPVSVAGTGPYYFLVDTGADRTAISRDLAGRLNLSPSQDARLHSISGPSSVATAVIRDLRLTSRPVTIQQAPLLNARHIGADGILGVDSLSKERVVFDFVAQTMSVVPSTAAEVRDEAGAIVVKARRRNGRLIISEAKADGRPVTVVLDTGAQVTIGNAALRKALRVGERLRVTGTIELESVTGGKVQGEVVTLPKVVVGGVTLANLVVVFADAHTFRQLELEQRPALLLGMNAMRAFKKVSIDFANRRFRVVVPEHSEGLVRLARL